MNKFIFIFDFGIACVTTRAFLLVSSKNGKRIFDDIPMFELQIMDECEIFIYINPISRNGEKIFL